MQVITSPVPYSNASHNRTAPVVFLAGGITGTADWQREFCQLLADVDGVLLNPRRALYPHDDPVAVYEQIAWEHAHLRKASIVAFWFPSHVVQPIALYELGAWSMTRIPLVVGADHDYPRRTDVIIQTGLVRPHVPIHATLADVAAGVRLAITEQVI